MKWEKFQNKVKRHPFIPSTIKLLGGNFARQAFVEAYVKYIAARVFEDLDMGTKSTFEKEFIGPNRLMVGTIVEFDIYLQVNELPMCIELNRTDTSIGEAIDSVLKKAEESDQRLIWEYVIRRKIRVSDANLIDWLSIEFFPFPRLYKARALPPVVTTPPSVAG